MDSICSPHSAEVFLLVISIVHSPSLARQYRRSTAATSCWRVSEPCTMDVHIARASDTLISDVA